MEKVKISKEQAECIELIRKDSLHEWKHRILRIAMETCPYMPNDKDAPLRRYFEGFGVDKAVNLLAYGFEVEETPEDKVRIDFDKAHYDNLGEALAYRNGIMRTLKLLNIKIEGIN